MLVDGYKGNKYEGFKTLENAKAYMQENDISNYDMVGELGQFDLAVKMRDRRYYAVANGLETGIYESYWYVARCAALNPRSSAHTKQERGQAQG